MANKLLNISYALICLSILNSCFSDVDLDDFVIQERSVNSRFKQSIEWNEQHPPTVLNVTSDSYNLITVGDCHVGSTTNLESIFDESIQEKSTAIVFNGDNCTGHKEDYNTFCKVLSNNQTIPALTLVGNHDLFFNGWDSYISKLGSASYTFEVTTTVATDWYICLDTGSGTLGKEQLAWFKDQLSENRKKYRNCIVFTHNNLFRFRHTTSTNPIIEEIYVLLDLFLKYQIDMVITSHDHKRNIDELGNTTHVILDDFQDKSSNASYLKLNVENGKINYNFVEL